MFDKKQIGFKKGSLIEISKTLENIIERELTVSEVGSFVRIYFNHLRDKQNDFFYAINSNGKCYVVDVKITGNEVVEATYNLLMEKGE